MRAVADGMLAPGTVLDGTYEIVRLVGVGGVGEVYEAVHTRISGRYAVKVLLGEVSKHEEVLKRFRREAEVTSALRHPNIVQVVDFNRLPDGAPYLVMEFLDGVELAGEIERIGPFRLARVVDVVGQIASALAAAHCKNVIHRDLKPQNLFVTRVPGDDRDIIKILDFGISKVRESTTKLTRQAAVIGTPQYMAPEQALGHIDEIDERTDLFSLAAITYEMLTGCPPFRGEAIDAILYQVVHEAPPPFPQPMPAIEAVVLRGMAKNKNDRQSGVREFHQELAKATDSTELPPSVPRTLLATEFAVPAAHLEIPAPTAMLPTVTTLGKAASMVITEEPIESRRRRWPWLVAILVAVVGMASAWQWLRTGTPAKPQQLADVAPVVPTPQPDAGFPMASRPDVVQQKQATPLQQATRKARAPADKKKPTKLRMEDL
jgi:serine/threonine-protein kinase